jgi:hypothetical protein
MKEHERRSRPVLFFTKDSEFPYWGKGSSFFVSSDQNVYWITARHVMENQGAAESELMITPGHGSEILVPFNEQTLEEQNPKYEGFQDIYILRVNTAEYYASKDAVLYAWDIDHDFFDNGKLSTGDDLYILGYPSESRFVDYELKNIEVAKANLHVTYQGPSIEEHCHTLQLDSSITIEDFDGLSGGVVIRYPLEANEPIQLVGMIIRGSAKEGFIHCIDSAVINESVRILEAT